MQWAEPFQIVRKVVEVLDTLKVPYLIGGSLASSLHGIPRATLDADLVADLGIRHVELFVSVLSKNFYMDAAAMREAIRNRSSFNRAVKSPLLVIDERGLFPWAFNSSDGSDSPPLAALNILVHYDTLLLAVELFTVIHLQTMFKVDIFVLKDDEFSKNEMDRREKIGIEEDAGRDLFVASAEDTLLHKLFWFQAGGGVSERQWGDVIGILRVQGKKLDRAYLERMAKSTRVKDLLEKATHEVD